MDSIIFFILYLIIILLTINSYFTKKIVNNYVLIFNIWWLFWLLVSYLNIGEFYPIDLKTYIYIYTGLIFFNLSIYFKINKSYEKIKNINSSYLSVLYLIEILFFIMNIVYLFKMSQLVDMIGEYWKVRFIYFGIPFGDITDKLFSVPIATHLYNLLRMFSLINFLISLGELESKKRNRLYIVVVNMFLYSILSGGRDFINYIIIFAIYAFKKKLIYKYFKYILLMCVIVLLMTFLREGSLSKIYMALVTYFTGSISYFDYLIKNDNGIRYYGELTFSSIIAPLKLFLRALGIDTGVSGMSQVGIELMESVQLSDTNSFYKLFNALATSFYWQFKDLGYAGIIFVNLAIGILYNFLYNRFNGNYAIVLFSYLEYLMILSIFSFKFTDLFSIFPVIVLIFLFKYNKNEEAKKL